MFRVGFQILTTLPTLPMPHPTEYIPLLGVVTSATGSFGRCYQLLHMVAPQPPWIIASIEATTKLNSVNSVNSVSRMRSESILLIKRCVRFAYLNLDVKTLGPLNC